MIPILYEPETTANVDYTSTIGIGTLTDCVSCHVVEERNGEYYMEMTYPVGGAIWDKIAAGYIIKAVPSDGAAEQLFRITSVRPLLTGRIEITAEHISRQAKYIAVRPITGQYDCISLISALRSRIVHVGSSGQYDAMGGLSIVCYGASDTASVNIRTPRTLMETLMGAAGSMTDIWNCEFGYDNMGRTFHVYTASGRGSVRDIGITYGVNMTNLDIENAINANFNAVYGYYYDSNSRTYVSSEYAIPADTQYEMGAFRCRTKIIDFTTDYEDSVPSAADLRTKAASYAARNGSAGPDFTAKIAFAPTWQSLDYATIADGARINLCDTVPITYEKYGITLTAKVIKTDFDVLTERYRSIEVGTAKKNLGKLLAQTAKSAGVSVYR